MNDKSHVSLEQHRCQVCGVLFDTGSILLDKRLRASLLRKTTTGWGLCPEHQKLFSDGFIALIEFDPERSTMLSGAVRLNSEQAFRTGRLAHLKREAFSRIFKTEPEADQACIFVELGIIDRLLKMQDSASD
jgi:hypothetical protein